MPPTSNRFASSFLLSFLPAPFSLLPSPYSRDPTRPAQTITLHRPISTRQEAGQGDWTWIGHGLAQHWPATYLGRSTSTVRAALGMHDHSLLQFAHQPLPIQMELSILVSESRCWATSIESRTTSEGIFSNPFLYRTCTAHAQSDVRCSICVYWGMMLNMTSDLYQYV